MCTSSHIAGREMWQPAFHASPAAALPCRCLLRATWNSRRGVLHCTPAPIMLRVCVAPSVAPAGTPWRNHGAGRAAVRGGACITRWPAQGNPARLGPRRQHLVRLLYALAVHKGAALCCANGGEDLRRKRHATARPHRRCRPVPALPNPRPSPPPTHATLHAGMWSPRRPCP